MARSLADRSWCRQLRRALVVTLLDTGVDMTVPDLVTAVAGLGFDVPYLTPKRVSDVLRCEVDKDRVRRIRHGLYRAGRMPRSTEWWFRREVESYAVLVAQAVAAPGGGAS